MTGLSDSRTSDFQLASVNSRTFPAMACFSPLARGTPRPSGVEETPGRGAETTRPNRSDPGRAGPWSHYKLAEQRVNAASPPALAAWRRWLDPTVAGPI